MKQQIKRIDIYLLTGVSTLFLIFYLLLSYYNRPASQDFVLISFLKEFGWLGSVKYQYFLWNNRWASYLYFNSLFSLGDTFLEYNKYIFLYHLGSISLFIFAIYSIFDNLCKHLFREQPPFIILVNYSVLFCALFYFITFQAIEVWFWLRGTFFYWQSFIMSCLGFAFILKKQNSLLNNVIIALCFTYVGGAVENYSLVLIAFFIVCLLFLLKRMQYRVKYILQNPFVKKMILGLMFLFSSSVFTYTAPGVSDWNKYKMEIEAIKNQINTAQYNKTISLQNFFKPLSKRSLSYIIFQKKHIVFLLLLLPFVFLGYIMRKYKFVLKDFIFGYSFKKLIFISILLFFFFCCISLLPIIYLGKNIGHERTWTPISFFIVLFSCFWCFYLGYKVLLNIRIIKSFFYLSLSSGIIILGLYIFRQYPIISTYAAAYDNRIQHLYLLNENGYTNTLILEPLPPSGMLVSGDITDNSDAYVNRSLCKALELNFKVRLE